MLLAATLKDDPISRHKVKAPPAMENIEAPLEGSQGRDPASSWRDFSSSMYLFLLHGVMGSFKRNCKWVGVL